MSSLKDSIALLESDLKAAPPRINVYHDQRRGYRFCRKSNEHGGPRRRPGAMFETGL